MWKLRMRLAFVLFLLLAVSDSPVDGKRLQSALNFHFEVVKSTRFSIEVGNALRNMVREKMEFLTLFLGSEADFEKLAENKEECDPFRDCSEDRTSPYRSADGTCNNLVHPNHGAANTGYKRFLNPEYEDGISKPRMYMALNELLPSPRKVSQWFHSGTESDQVESSDYTHMVMQWGQFLAHDLSITPVQANIVEDDTESLSCCDDVKDNHSDLDIYRIDQNEKCFPIPIPKTDSTYRGKRCMHFARSVQCRNAKCHVSPVEQLNQITAFIDASNVYGSSEDKMIMLRQKRNGLLIIDETASDAKGCSREAGLPSFSCGRSKCLRTGDVRSGQQIALSGMHTLFMREHNRIAQILQASNWMWDDEKVFQETRRIVGAMMQMITYKEFLPIVLGTKMDDYLSNYTTSLPRNVHDRAASSGYDPKVDPSIRNAFATAAFRFGHSQIKSSMASWDQNLSTREDVSKLGNLFGDVESLINNRCLADKYIRGLVADSCPIVDRFLSPEVTEHLFEDENGNSFDLASLNIQRGRDHGLPGYNAWREFCGLPGFDEFDDMTEHSEKERYLLSKLYAWPAVVDLFTAGVSERHVEGGIVGETFACIIGKQFQALRAGDRYWYQNTGVTGFSERQLAELEKVTLSKVICHNTDTQVIQPYCMKSTCTCNKRVSCQELLQDDMNLYAWEE